MLKLVLTFAVAALAHPQQPIDKNVLDEIFGAPPSTTTLTPITVRPTDASTTFLDKNGEICRCVPYYLCDADLIAIDENNSTVTGWGELDIRFKEDECQESVERCCKSPKTEEEVPAPTPSPNRPQGCGHRNPKGLDFTITGGTGLEAEFGEFPWVVALLDASNNTYVGVGVLIHPQVVMTGAHVAARLTDPIGKASSKTNYRFTYQPGRMKIRAGEWDTQTAKERLRHQEGDVQEIVMHEEYRPKILWNDIALLRLSQPLQLADHINVICLPDQDESFDNSKNCVANGWGKDVFGQKGLYAVIMKKIEINMVPHARCNELLKKTRLGNKFRLHWSFVCAGGERGKDTCQGDGGAPLACPIGGDRYKLSGLVAWGIECGAPNVPGVYASVAPYRNWIDDKMAGWGLETNGYIAK